VFLVVDRLTSNLTPTNIRIMSLVLTLDVTLGAFQTTIIQLFITLNIFLTF